MIKLEHGKTYENKTYRYIYPLFKSIYGKKIKEMVSNEFFVAAVGIKDNYLPEFDNHFFLCIDVKTTRKEKLSRILEMIQYYENYETDYAIYNGFHMIVFKLNTFLSKALIKFKQSKYSEITEALNPNLIYSDKDVIAILKKTDSARESYINELKKKFDIDDEVINEMNITEYDFPIDESEIFN